MNNKTKAKREKLSCQECRQFHCYRRNGPLPGFCLTEATAREELADLARIYREEEKTAALSCAAAEVEGRYYGRLTRVEEVAAFARRVGARKIGIASCIGLAEESQIFTRFLHAQGLESFAVICKVGAIDKTAAGIPEDLKIQPQSHEALCNPILQARILARENTDLNVMIGLCVGHDSLFMQHSAAPVTCLIVKDRVLGHNPVAALYASSFYYKRLFEKQDY